MPITASFGALGSIGFSKETTPGTAQTTVTNFFPFEQFIARQDHKVIDLKPSVGTMGDLPNQAGTLTPLGKLDTLMIASQPHPWYWALGKVTTTGSSTYTHTMVLDPAGALPSLTCEGNLVAQTVKQAGVNINKLTLKCSTGEVGKLSMEWNGLTHTDAATLTSTPTYQNDYLLFTGATATINGTAAVDISDMELTIENGLEPKFVVGSRNPGILHRKQIPKISGKITFIDYPTTLYTSFISATSIALVLTFANGTKNLTINMPCCGIVKGFDKDIKSEVVTADIEFQVFQDPSTSNIITVTSAGTSVATLTT